ncbi:hypothetical protein [Arthrobacter sp. YN]|uniref:hypothetical protein n=1 Tax=Arthrobacter sp. YN TaxID=2020486 RepID=UPI0012FD6441|nr:hypothetical protein [Arthrobacter sp. YN]
MNHNDIAFSVNETWFGDWNPLRDEYGYPINTSMPTAFYLEHGSSVIKRWIPEQG